MPRERMVMERGKIVSELVIHIVKTIAADFLKTKRYTSSAENVMVLCGIWIGQAEGRPMTVAKLAQFIGMPRGTVIRKVNMLKERGLIKDIGRGRLTNVFDADHMSKQLSLIVEDNIKSIHSASRKLSKMDNG